VAEALADVVEVGHSPLAAQSGPASEDYAAAALRDPSRQTELQAMLSAFAGESEMTRDA
jgi:hypothetical protein